MPNDEMLKQYYAERYSAEKLGGLHAVGIYERTIPFSKKKIILLAIQKKKKDALLLKKMAKFADGSGIQIDEHNFSGY